MHSSRGLSLGILLLAAGLFGVGCGKSAPDRPAARAPDLPRDPDIVLVTLDTLRADSLGFGGNRRVKTPNLDRLAAQGRVFSAAHAHNVVTLPSHANILTGLLPYQHGIRDNTGFRLAPGTPTVASLLKEKGYATAAFVGAFPLDSRFGLSAGFDVYDDRYPRGKTALDFEMPERPAQEVVSAAKRWWDQSSGKRRFLWVHLYDCHAPYRPPAPFRDEYRDDPYLGEVAAIDTALEPLLGPFVSGREARPTLIVVTSDHGEALGDHGEETHGLFGYETTLRVPLVLWLGKTVSPSVTEEPVGHVDIGPTILEAAGVPKPAPWTGASLFPPRVAAGAERTYFEAYSTAYNRGWAPLRGVIAGRLKFIDLPLPELYDLEEDPAEARNLFGERGEEARRLARLIPEESRLAASRREKPAAEEVRELRSLGYLSGRSAIKDRYGPEDDPKGLIGVDRDLHRCVDLYQRGKVPEAIALARQVVRERPSMEIGYGNLGFLLRQQGASAEALAVYRKAVEAGVAGEELATHYGLALCEAGRASEAVALLSPLSGSSDPNTLNALGIAYADAGRPADAARILQRALEIDPGDVEAHENLGIVRLREGNLSLARDLFEKALSLDPGLPRSWNGLGVALARLGREREAMEAWTKAVALDPKLYDALYNLGLTAGKNGMRREARAALQRFVATAPVAQYRTDVARARALLAALEAGGS